MKWFRLTEKQLGILLIIVVVLILVIQFYYEKKNEQSLKNSKQTIAFIINIDKGSPKNPKSGLFYYNVEGKYYEFRQSGNYSNFKLGDTVLIEYAIEDHSVARVVDKYYMKKYQYLKGK